MRVLGLKVKPKFTKKEIDTAIRVLKASGMVRKWVKSQAEFLDMDLSTPKGQEFNERLSTKLAKDIIK